MLGTALVHYYPPKHHTRALRILDDVLLDDDANVPSLMGRAYILQASKDWGAAAELFLRVNELLPGDVDEGIRAQEEHAWCMLKEGNGDLAVEELEAVSEALDHLDDREVDQARCWWRIGKCAWESKGSNTLPSSAHALTRFCRIRPGISMFHHGSKTIAFFRPRVF